MLDDDRRLQIRRDLLDALDRGDRLRPIVVERRHAIGTEILAEMDRIAAENDGSASLTSRLE